MNEKIVRYLLVSGLIIILIILIYGFVISFQNLFRGLSFINIAIVLFAATVKFVNDIHPVNSRQDEK